MGGNATFTEKKERRSRRPSLGVAPTLAPCCPSWEEYQPVAGIFPKKGSIPPLKGGGIPRFEGAAPPWSGFPPPSGYPEGVTRPVDRPARTLHISGSNSEELLPAPPVQGTGGVTRLFVTRRGPSIYYAPAVTARPPFPGKGGEGSR